MSNSTIVYKDRLIRVNPENAYRLDYSSNGGRTWLRLHDKNANTGEFKELIDKRKRQRVFFIPAMEGECGFAAVVENNEEHP